MGLEDPHSRLNLELNWYPVRSKFAPRFTTGDALDQLRFLLGSVSRKKLEAEYERLIRRGARPTSITPQSSYGWQARVLDPDGNWIEVYRTPTAEERRGSRRRNSKNGPGGAPVARTR